MSVTNNQPKPGDVIWADRIAKGLRYNHCGVYIGGGRVIHFAAPEGSEVNPENAVIHETSFEIFKDDCAVKIVKFPEGYPPEETVRRAREQLGKRGIADNGYAFTTNNCDHFATWCKIGKHESLQVEGVKAVLKTLGGPTGEIICAIHDIAEGFKAPKLDGIEKPATIIDSIDANSELADSMAVPEAEEMQGENPRVFADVDVAYIEQKSKQGSSELLPQEVPDSEEAETEDNELAVIDDEQPDAEPYDPGEDDSGEGGDLVKPSKIDVIADKLKGITYAVAGALETVKQKLPPPLNRIPYQLIAVKVANTIDKVATVLKVITGKLTPAEAHEEFINADAALLGTTVAKKQTQPIKEVVKETFGKVGAGIKHIVQKAVQTFVPQSVRAAIKTGVQRFGQAVASGVRTVVKLGTKVASGIKTAGRAVVGFVGRFFGRK